MLVFAGKFIANGRSQLLTYTKDSNNWWLMDCSTLGSFKWIYAGNTQGFGDLTRPAVRFYSGDFTGDGRVDLLLYSSSDGNWWLGQVDTGNHLKWTLAGNTKGFGDLTRPAVRFYSGDFTGDGRVDLLLYSSSDGNWWLGQVDTGNHLKWTLAGNTKGFGDLTRPAVRFYSGDFTGDGRVDLLLYSSSDGNWWLGQVDTGNHLKWTLAGNTKGFGDLTRPAVRFYSGDFTGDGRVDLLLYSSSDGNWWLGQVDTGNHLKWTLAGNTKGFGDLTRPAVRFYSGDFTGDGRVDLLLYSSSDGNWWLGQVDTGNHLKWTLAGNTKGFGDLTRPTITFAPISAYSGKGGVNLLFNFLNDGTWWMGTWQSTGIVWNNVGNELPKEIADFSSRTTKPAWLVNRKSLAGKLITMLKNPDEIDQAGFGFCGLAAFLRCWIQRDPVGVGRFAMELYETGASKIGANNIAPDSDLLNCDFGAMPMAQTVGIGASEWMLLSALQYDANWVLDFEGKPSEDWSQGAIPSSIARLFEDSGCYDQVNNDTSTFGSDPDTAKRLQPGDMCDIVLMINAQLLPGGSKDTGVFTRHFSNHFIGLLSPVTFSGRQVTFKYFSWGETPAGTFTDTDFMQDYYGAIIATATRPRQVISFDCLLSQP